MQDPERETRTSSPGWGTPWRADAPVAPAAAGNGGPANGRPAEPMVADDGADVLAPVTSTALAASARSQRRIPEATVTRLPVYLRSLVEVAEAHIVTVSSERLAEMAGVNAAKVRKDLSYLGSYGTRGVGYDVEFLLAQINRVLGLTQDWPVVIVGIGNLGHALANYKGFSARGFRIAALVDADAKRVGEVVSGVTVRHLDDLPAIAVADSIAIGIVATPASSAQKVADLLVAAGVTSILNFAPALISVPSDVSLRKVDLSIELQILSFYQQLRVVAPQVAGA